MQNVIKLCFKLTNHKIESKFRINYSLRINPKKFYIYQNSLFNYMENYVWRNPLKELTEKNVLSYRPGLKILNSLTGNKDEFITQNGGRTVTWYMCGPTVYDYSHLGHARTYVSFDVIRKIMTHYFNYDIQVT